MGTADPLLVARTRALARLAWLMPALLAAALCLIRITWPGLGSDEFATWGMATTSWHEFWRLSSSDAASTPYYLFVRVWVEVFGASDFALRLPSVLFTIGTVALLAVLGTRLLGARTGLLAGLLLAVVPTTSRYAQEARPDALVSFAAVLATLLLVRMLERPSHRRSGDYGAAIALLGLANPLALLLLVAHGVVAVIWRRRLPSDWLLAAYAGTIPATPVIFMGGARGFPLTWMSEAAADPAGYLPVDLFGSAVVAGVLIALAMLGFSWRPPIAVFAMWAAVPMVLVSVISQLANLWLSRHLLFGVPAWAMLGAAVLNRIPVLRAVACIVAVGLLGLPVQAAIRGAAGHDQATALLASVLAENEQAGDGIIYAQNDVGGFWLARDVVAHYVPADRRPTDVLLLSPPRTGGHVAATECTDPEPCIGNAARLWVIRSGELKDPSTDLGFTRERVLRERYRLSRSWTLPGLTLAIYVTRPELRVAGS